MINLDKLVKLADSFYSLTAFAQDKQVADYAIWLVNQMKGYAKGGIASTNHLLKSYPTSAGLKELSKAFPQLDSILNRFSYRGDSRGLSSELANQLAEMEFYSSSGNAGTGQDAQTTISEGGYTPPSYYVTTIKQLNDRLMGLQPVHQTESVSRDPMSETLTQQSGGEPTPIPT